MNYTLKGGATAGNALGTVAVLYSLTHCLISLTGNHNNKINKIDKVDISRCILLYLTNLLKESILLRAHL